MFGTGYFGQFPFAGVAAYVINVEAIATLNLFGAATGTPEILVDVVSNVNMGTTIDPQDTVVKLVEGLSEIDLTPDGLATIVQDVAAQTGIDITQSASASILVDSEGAVYIVFSASGQAQVDAVARGDLELTIGTVCVATVVFQPTAFVFGFVSVWALPTVIDATTPWAPLPDFRNRMVLVPSNVTGTYVLLDAASGAQKLGNLKLTRKQHSEISDALLRWGRLEHGPYGTNYPDYIDDQDFSEFMRIHWAQSPDVYRLNGNVGDHTRLRSRWKMLVAAWKERYRPDHV